MKSLTQPGHDEPPDPFAFEHWLNVHAAHFTILVKVRWVIFASSYTRFVQRHSVRHSVCNMVAPGWKWRDRESQSLPGKLAHDPVRVRLQHQDSRLSSLDLRKAARIKNAADHTGITFLRLLWLKLYMASALAVQISTIVGMPCCKQLLYIQCHSSYNYIWMTSGDDELLKSNRI